MTPHEALTALISADQNYAYSVSQTHWAHLPSLAGNPHNFVTRWEVGFTPLNQTFPTSVAYHEDLESAVRQLLAKMGKDWPEAQPASDAIGKPDAGDGWRFLEAGEIIEDGDEIRQKHTDQWVLAQLSIGCAVNPWDVMHCRRRLH